MVTSLSRRRWLGWAAAGCPLAAQAAAVLPPLQRPAIALRDTRRAALHGLARAGRRIIAVGARGVVLLSDDEGQRWRQAAQVPVSVALTAVQFVDERRGWAVGHQGVVLHSDDGGERWRVQLDGLRLAALQAEAVRGGGRPADVSAAQRLLAEGADKPLLALDFADARQGLVAGAFGLLVATQDGGASWQSWHARLPNEQGAHLYALQRAGDELLLAGEQGLVLHSADAGRSFERRQTAYQGSWFCAVRESDGAWLVAGLRGNAERSRDGGRSWQRLASPMPVSFTAALDDPGGRSILVNQGGDLLALVPGNDRLGLITHSAAQQPGQVVALADEVLLLAGWNGLTRVQT